MTETATNLTPEFKGIFEIIKPNKEVVALVSSYKQEEQNKVFLALKEIIQDDITLILMLMQANKCVKNENQNLEETI